MIRAFVVTFLFGFASTASAAPIWTASLLPPSGNITAAPGDTNGWGYSITNSDLSLWLVPFNLDADTFEHGTPESLFLFPAVGPGLTVDVPYTGVDGLYQFTWDADAPAGFINLGLFVISADWYTGDPGAGGAFSESGGITELAYSITAAESTGNPVPEPSTLLFIGAGIAFVLSCRRA